MCGILLDWSNSFIRLVGIRAKCDHSNVFCSSLLPSQILKPAEKKKPNSSRPVTPPRNMVTKQAKKWDTLAVHFPFWTCIICFSFITASELLSGLVVAWTHSKLLSIFLFFNLPPFLCFLPIFAATKNNSCPQMEWKQGALHFSRSFFFFVFWG